MRHSRKRTTLGRPADQRRALMRTLARELFQHGQITTTLTKAKVLRSYVEKLITKALKASKESDTAKQLHYKRQVVKDIYPDVLSLIMERVAKLQRTSGYTRILKMPFTRSGDNTQMAIIQILDQD